MPAVDCLLATVAKRVHLRGAGTISPQGYFCTHGRYCGKGCSGEVDGKSFMASPIDALDRACFFHDKCFDDSGSCRDRCCNAALRSAANEV